MGEYPKDVVEAVAKAITPNGGLFWERMSDARREAYRSRANSCLDVLGLTVEYAPGHVGPNGAFVGAGRIAPGYVQQYIREGGVVVSHLETPWVEVG